MSRPASGPQPVVVRGEPLSVVAVRQTAQDWETPGTHMALAAADRPEVRLVLERLEADRSTVFVVLERDPEDLLDLLFDAERALAARFKGRPVDVRVLTPPAGWTDGDLRRDALLHLERPPVAAASGSLGRG